MSPRRSRKSLNPIVGPEIYQVWVKMLSILVPDGRTHRLAALIAAMLRYALQVGLDDYEDEPEETSAISSLLAAEECGSPYEASEILKDLLETLFEDAGVDSERVSARGDPYSIIDAAVEEYVAWYNMPWE